MPDYGIRGVITWLYYRDLPWAMRFYEEVMGLKMVVDQGARAARYTGSHPTATWESSTAPKVTTRPTI